MAYRGHVENGKIVLDEAPTLVEGAAVLVQFTSIVAHKPQALGERQPRTLRECLEPYIGIGNDLPEDMSRNVDHYLYGGLKES